MEAVSEGSVDVIVALPLCRDQEREGAIGREDVHAAVLLSVPGQESNAALFHIQVGSHGVQCLKMEMYNRAGESKVRIK